MRLSPSQALRYGEVTVGYGRACVGSKSHHSHRSHLLPSLKHHSRNQHANGLGSEPHAPRFATRAFNSSVVARYGRNGESQSRVSPPRRDQRIYGGQNNRHDNNSHRGRGRIGNNFINNHDDGHWESIRPSYIAKMETRAREHIQSFPDIRSSNTDHAAAALSPWHRTTVEIVMLMSKLWGKRMDRGLDQMQLCRIVSLANDLLMKVLLARQEEIDYAMEQYEGQASGNEPDYDANHKKTRQWGGIERENTEILCQTVALGWSRCDPKIATDAARNAQAILDTLEDICFKRAKLNDNTLTGKKSASFDLTDVMSSTSKLYNHVLSTWSRSSDPDAEKCMKALLDRMTDESRGTLFPRPDTISYNNMLNLYANLGNVDAAEALLLQMEKSIHGVTADVYSYSIVMNALQKRFTSRGPSERSRKDPERAEELLSHLVAKYEESGFKSAKLRPSIVTFGTVISMYSQADRILKKDDRSNESTRNWKSKNMSKSFNDRDSIGWGATNAERVLDWIIGLNERERKSKKVTSVGEGGTEKRGDGFRPENELIRPTAHHFMSVIDAWAKAGRGAEGARRSERLLNRLDSLYEKLGYDDLRPNPLTFGAVIDAWAKADDKHESAEHAESFLDRMEELFLYSREKINKREMISNVAYNLVIDAWSRRQGNVTADRAKNILRRLESNYQLTNNSSLRPDVISYTGVMKAYVNHPDGGKKALEILDEMNDQYRDGNARARPDMKCISVAMDACAKSGLTSEAERLLNDIDDSKKNCLMFNTIISGYTSEGRGSEADAVLRRMISLSENEGWERCSPDLISYTLCLRAWGNGTSQERVLRARALLDECIRRYQSGDKRCKPSDVIFNDFADIVSNSDEIKRETDVLALFEKMESIGCEPSLISFNILIKTCAKCANGTDRSDERKRNALQIAASAFNSLPSVGLRADSVTYTGMMHVLLNLMDNSTEKMSAIGRIFRQCCNEGYLNQHILNILAAAISEDDMMAITGVSSIEEASTLNHLPPEWNQKSSRDATAKQQYF